jgi:hypothetical protein
MIHIFVPGMSLAFNVSRVDYDRFVPAALPEWFEARCLDEEEALAIIERAGLVLGEVEPDGMQSLRTPIYDYFSGWVTRTDTIAELQAHLASDLR